MLLADGYHDVPAGDLATVVTYLEMTAPPTPRVERTAPPWTLRPVTHPDVDWYRGLYRRVGADWLWLHTCTLDAPQALPFYLRSGFVPYARKVEVCDDPRLIGVLPETAAPHVPLIRR